MALKGKIFKFMSAILKDGSYYKLNTQAKSTSACGLPKGFFLVFYPSSFMLNLILLITHARGEVH